MGLFFNNLESLSVCALLTFVAAALTVVFSLVCGATLAFHARPKVFYGVGLVSLFIPYAVGASVWAYCVAHFASSTELKQWLVATDSFNRGIILLLFCLAKSVPLGTFFCATVLHRYTADVHAYFRTHFLGLPFYVWIAIRRVPSSIVLLVGMFGGAMIASESSIPTYLYRANPGTGPETANLIFSRLFRELYASTGTETLGAIAATGVGVAVLLLGAAVTGTAVGKFLITTLHNALSGSKIFSVSKWNLIAATILRAILTFCYFPVMILALGLAGPVSKMDFSSIKITEFLLEYQPIIWLGVFVAVTITTAGLAIAVRLRYSQKDLLVLVEQRWWGGCILVLPTFVPVLTIIALVGFLSHGNMTGAPAYLGMYFSHIFFHYSVFQFICIALIASVPERRVAWQRAVSMSFAFSFYADGIKRHSAIIVALIALGTVQVISDGAVSRWYSHLVESPDERLTAAVFGRLSNSSDATMIVLAIVAITSLIATAITTAFLRELKSTLRNA